MDLLAELLGSPLVVSPLVGPHPLQPPIPLESNAEPTLSPVLDQHSHTHKHTHTHRVAIYGHMKHSQVSFALFLFDWQKVQIITGFSPVCKPPAEDFGDSLRW